ncbi:MAG: hypothetical protein K0Q95_1230 [Bacteroidota bacterium]|jgi:hemoglobin/transferrin/lactoferrin receptor protein|nr:hypothetical protein [Bacteroidota bacterium]
MRTKLYLAFAVLTCSVNVGIAQEKDTITRLINLNEVIFSANKAEEKKIDVPYSVEVISSKIVELENPQTAADMLANTGQVMVQKSQAGGGSPIIRGFEASRVLIVVDGVRMNNAIYRAGHLQDVITIDNAMLERTEILFGPSSVMYGSDALGGVMHFYTKKPLFGEDKMNLKVNAALRYASANQEKTGHVDFNLGFKKIASLTSITYSDFDDLRTGNGRNPNPDFGKCYYYVGQNWNGTADSTIRNNDPNVQKRSGYSQIDLMEKLLFKVNDKTEVGLNLQYSTSSNINRYDRLTEAGSAGNLKFAEWYYGPQNRLMAALYANIKGDSSFFDNMRITAAYQMIRQERTSRRFSTNYLSPTSGNNKRTSQIEDVGVMSLNADLRKSIKEKHELSYGLEFVNNIVNSTATSTHIRTGEQFTPVATRYPNGGSTMMNIGAYLTHSWEINEKMILSEGIRYTYNSLSAKFDTAKTESPFQFPFTSVKQTNSALNGNLGLVVMPEKNVRFSILGSTGFRAPNVDDMAKVFESSGSVIIVPNEKLKPEYAYNIEVSLSTTIMDDKLKVEGGYYYTLLENAIVLKDSKFNGADSVMFNGTLSQVRSSQNVDQAYIQGAWGAVYADFSEHVSFKSTLNYTLGEYRQHIPTANDPGHDTIMALDHIAPMFGQTSLFFHYNKFEAEVYARYSAAKLAKDYSLGKEDNELYSADPVKGYMPGWSTLNIKTAYKITKNFSVNLGVENLFNKHYRVFASGVSSPGRNIVVALRAKF